MATTTSVSVPTGDTWTLLYTAAGTVTLHVQSRAPAGDLLVRVGSATATSDSPDDPAEMLNPREMRAIPLASGDKVHARTLAPNTAVVTLRV